jgi:hypothetical protein
MQPVLKPCRTTARQDSAVKLRDFQYNISLDRYHGFAGDPITVCASVCHSDGEELSIYFYEEERPEQCEVFWSSEYAQALYEGNYTEADEMQKFYLRLYKTRIVSMLQR